MTNPSGNHNRGTVFNIQKYSVHDGPGIRTIIFLKGCSLRCQWCSNPESQTLPRQLAYNPEKCLSVDACQRCQGICPKNALSVGDDRKIVRDPLACDDCLLCAQACPNHALNIYGYEVTVDQALRRVEEDGVFYSRSGGGLTLSGGEPLFQAEFAVNLLREARKRRIDTCIETCGQVSWPVLAEAARYLNTIYYDVKCLDPEVHRQGTGAPTDLILTNLARLRAEFPRLPIRVRTPLVPGFNDNEETISGIVDFICGIPDLEYELLAYHRMGTPKYGYLGREYPLAAAQTIPEKRIKHLRDLANARLEQHRRQNLKTDITTCPEPDKKLAGVQQ